MATKHGQYGKPIYWVWAGMKKRCTSPSNPAFKDYGGRGISFDPLWTHFENFFDWAKSSGYKESLTLEREDTNGNYEPDNCKWIPRSLQNSNKRSNKIRVINGIEYPSAKEAALEFNVSEKTIRSWCEGQTVRGKFYPPKENCFNILLYGNKNDN